MKTIPGMPCHTQTFDTAKTQVLSEQEAAPTQEPVSYKTELLKSKSSANKCPLWLWFRQAGMCCLVQMCPEEVRAEHCPPSFSSQLPRMRKKGDIHTVDPGLLNYPKREKKPKCSWLLFTFCVVQFFFLLK